MERQQGDRHLTALAETTDPKKPKLLSREAIAKITEYRRSQNLTQKQLDQQLAFPPNTTNRLEARNLAPTSSQLTALNRVIKGGLRLES
jgi:ribosome-binding protein aMBF1 (putative translation factor)